MKGAQTLLLQSIILLVFFGLVLYIMSFTGFLPSWVTIEHAFTIDAMASGFFLILWHINNKEVRKNE